MTPEQEQKLNELYDFMLALKSSTTIPFDVGEAMKARVGYKTGVSGKTAGSETVTINEGGIATKFAANPHDGFFTLMINGLPKNVGYYD